MAAGRGACVCVCVCVCESLKSWVTIIDGNKGPEVIVAVQVSRRRGVVIDNMSEDLNISEDEKV